MEINLVNKLRKLEENYSSSIKKSTFAYFGGMYGSFISAIASGTLLQPYVSELEAGIAALNIGLITTIPIFYYKRRIDSIIDKQSKEINNCYQKMVEEILKR